MVTAPSVVFLDLPGLAAGLRQPAAFGDALATIAPGRVGVLCNLPFGQGPAAVGALVAAAGLEKVVAPDLIVVASGLGCPLPDRRAFAAAAVVAGVPPESCLFVSADLAALVSAAAAGLRTITIPATAATAAAPPATPPAGAPFAAAPSATSADALLAGEVDPDTGPTFILRGRVVTMLGKDDVIPNGRVVVSKGLIRAVLKPGAAVPAEFQQTPTVDVRGTIYPGLLDLHNHLVYNVLPLWVVPQKYDNRSQWPRHKEYKSNVSKPIKDALAKFMVSATAVIRYVEAKALIGGATTGQGIRTQTKAGMRGPRGAMRNVEETKDKRLPAAATNVPDLGTSAERIEAFRRTLQTRTAFFYHLSEGVDPAAHRHFENLVANDLIAEPLVGVHALALTKDDLEVLAAAKAKIVWSPFSNLLLYGKTLNLRDVKDSQVRFSIGCDWAPTGSRNLLQELKVADFVNNQQGKPFTAFDLVRAVTSEAAASVGWHKHLGQIRAGMMADLLVIAGTSADPYDHLIAATEPAVRLVTVHGVARYGDRAVLAQVHAGPSTDLEEVQIAGKPKVFFFRSDEPLLNELTFKAAVRRLQEAMADLPGFIQRMQTEGDALMALGVDQPQALTLEVDNEFEQDPLMDYPVDEAGLLADDVAMAESVDLDGPAVAGDADYMALVAQEKNIPPALITHLKTKYGL